MTQHGGERRPRANQPERAARKGPRACVERSGSPATIHMSPPDGSLSSMSGIMPCCGRTPFEVMLDRITVDPRRVTCRRSGPSLSAARQMARGARTPEELEIALELARDVALGTVERIRSFMVKGATPRTKAGNLFRDTMMLSLEGQGVKGLDEYKVAVNADIAAIEDEARRATVARIRERLTEDAAYSYDPGAGSSFLDEDKVATILDEVGG